MQGVSTVVVMMMVMALAVSPSLATKLVVGGSQGWDLATDLSSWASSNTFKVGDQLVFKYTPGLHSVVELAGEKQYNNCDMAGAPSSMNGGSNTVKLKKSGYRYFACGTAGHCEQGMKVKVKIVAASGATSQADANASSSNSASASLPCVNGFACISLVVVVAWMHALLFH